jgi:hypothetical protein
MLAQAMECEEVHRNHLSPVPPSGQKTTAFAVVFMVAMGGIEPST